MNDKATKDEKHVSGTDATNNTPRKIKVGGVHVAIWTNVDEKTGRKYATFSLQRTYKRANGSWANTASFRLNDIPKAILALQKAYEEVTLLSRGEHDGSETDG